MSSHSLQLTLLVAFFFQNQIQHLDPILAVSSCTHMCLCIDIDTSLCLDFPVYKIFAMHIQIHFTDTFKKELISQA